MKKIKYTKRMDNNYPIPDLVQTLSCVENGGLNRVLQLAKHLTCMTVASKSIVFTKMCEHNKQT